MWFPMRNIYDLQKDVLNAVLLAFERKAGEWCDVSLLWQTFVQQVRSSSTTVEAIARKHSRTISPLPSMIRAEALTVHAKQLAQVEQYGVFASRTPLQPAMPKGQPQQGGHSNPPAVGGKPMVQQQRGAPPSKPGAGEAATDMNKSGVLECKGCGRRNHAKDMCNLAQHPDFNTENCWWGQSSKGKAWAARGGRYLPKDLSTLATQPTDQQKPPANKGKLASIHMSETSDLKPYVLMCSLSFRPAYEEIRQVETRVAFDTQAQTDRSLISAGLIENLIKISIIT
jgi:hypothetical protein